MANKKTGNIDAILEEATKEIVNKPVAKTNSTEVEHERKFNKTELKRKGLVNTYREEKKVAISISPFYAPYLGKVVRQIVNGIVVDVPADGKTYKVNETHASHIISKLKRVDAMISRQQKAGDVQNNFEYSPGQLHL